MEDIQPGQSMKVLHKTKGHTYLYCNPPTQESTALANVHVVTHFTYSRVGPTFKWTQVQWEHLNKAQLLGD